MESINVKSKRNEWIWMVGIISFFMDDYVKRHTYLAAWIVVGCVLNEFQRRLKKRLMDDTTRFSMKLAGSERAAILAMIMMLDMSEMDGAGLVMREFWINSLK